MATTFGGFVHRSPLSSLPHDAKLTLASNCIRDYFGPTVQTVADCLESRGGSSTLAQLVVAIRGQCRRVWNEERERLVARVAGGKYKLHRAKGPATSGYVVEEEYIRHALLILVQHSLVHVDCTQQKKPTYRFLLDRARFIPRYPRYIEYIKRAVDETAATLVEELLMHGRMKTVDAVVATVNRLQEVGSADSKPEKYTLRQSVVESFRRMVEGGFIEKVPIFKKHVREEEFEFEADNDNVKAVKVEEDGLTTTTTKGDDPAVVALLGDGAYRNSLPRDAVWRVNIGMFHDTLRAYSLGRLVAESFNNKVGASGSMITAALRLAAHKKYALKLESYEEQTEFTPDEIVMYLPKPVQKSLESKTGGILKNLSSSLVEISRLTCPTILFELEEAMAHPSGGKFQVATRQLVDHLRDKIYHQVVLDSHGEVAARICSILAEKGHLEADTIAETAMVPEKDTREILHELYRANYVSLFTLQQSKHHNPGSMIYLWTVVKPRLQQNIADNVCQAHTNLRLRRQHEESVGKDLIERAKEANDADVNEQEMDKANYNKFCLGLERLDNATLQLDETLMALLDF
jgi:DNA-directed RNA polymerase III subunit RPC3